MPSLRIAFVAVAVWAAGLINLMAPAAAGDGTVFASNYPLAYFAERIGGRAEIVRMPEAVGDPAFWRPTADDVIGMQKADVILMNGAGFEKWAAMVTLPRSRVVDTSAGFRDELIPVKGASTHQHGPAGTHAHSGTAFTTWIDFAQAAQQAEAVNEALLAAGIAPAAELTKNYETLRNDLMALDAAVRDMVAGKANVPLMGSHPVYDYFARRYGLAMLSVHWEPDQVPDDAAWAELAALRRDHPAAWMIWEADPLPETVAKLEAVGMRSVVFDPGSNRPETGDFMDVMRANLQALRTVFDAGS